MNRARFVDRARFVSRARFVGRAQSECRERYMARYLDTLRRSGSGEIWVVHGMWVGYSLWAGHST